MRDDTPNLDLPIHRRSLPLTEIFKIFNCSHVSETMRMDGKFLELFTSDDSNVESEEAEVHPTVNLSDNDDVNEQVDASVYGTFEPVFDPQ